MENNKSQLAAAFVKAQKAFAPALKQSTNPHFKSRYADLASCVDAVMGALNDNGIALIQNTHEDDSGTGVIVETMFLHESGEVMCCGWLTVPAARQDPQGYGSALTYARRYSLMAACGIAPEDDDGNAASKRPEIRINESQMVDHMSSMEAATNQDELKAAYVKAFAACNGDAAWQKKVVSKKDEIKGRFES